MEAKEATMVVEQESEAEMDKIDLRTSTTRSTYR
jgi:hypothetical protein